MKDDPGVSRGQLVRSVKQKITAIDDNRRLEECRALAVQGNLSRQFADRASTIWAQALWELPEKVMKFTLNAVQDTLPHNANLHLWKKLPSPNCPLCSERQTLLHSLNHCPVALKSRHSTSATTLFLNCCTSSVVATPALSNRSQMHELTWTTAGACQCMDRQHSISRTGQLRYGLKWS